MSRLAAWWRYRHADVWAALRERLRPCGPDCRACAAVDQWERRRDFRRWDRELSR